MVNAVEKCAICGSTGGIRLVSAEVTRIEPSGNRETPEFVVVELCQKCENGLNESLEAISVNLNVTAREPVIIAHTSDGTREFILVSIVLFIFFSSLLAVLHFVFDLSVNFTICFFVVSAFVYYKAVVYVIDREGEVQSYMDYLTSFSCPYCHKPLSNETINRLWKGKKIKCKRCKLTIFIYNLKEQFESELSLVETGDTY